MSVVGDKDEWLSFSAPKRLTPQRSRKPDSLLSPLDQAMITPTLYVVAEKIDHIASY